MACSTSSFADQSRSSSIASRTPKDKPKRHNHTPASSQALSHTDEGRIFIPTSFLVAPGFLFAVAPCFVSSEIRNPSDCGRALLASRVLS